MTRSRDTASIIPTVDAKGDLLVGTADNTVDNLPAGTNGTYLKANSASTTGLEWATGVESIVDAKGDLLVGTADNTIDNLSPGTNGQVLTANSATATGLQWNSSDGVRVFADAAARDLAISVPVEGMATYLEDSNLVSIYDGTNWKNSLGATGGILQVVQAIKTDAFVASVAAGGITSAILSASITPTSASSKVLVLVSAAGASTTDSVFITLFKNSSVITNATGNADGVRQRVTSGTVGGAGVRMNGSMAISYLDSPNTTSETTYDFRLSHGSGATRSVFLNRSDLNDNNTADSRAISTITLMEVAG
jgi:hypothetical protein